MWNVITGDFIMNRIIGLDDALLELYPNKKWSISETYDSLTWLEEGITKPTESELVSKQKELQDAWDAVEYQRQRAEEYPDWGSQLDYIYHNGIDKWKTDIVDPVKAKYPKSS